MANIRDSLSHTKWLCKFHIKADYKDLQQKYENPIQHACDIQEGQIFIANVCQRPEEMCESAWESISPFVMTLAHGGENIYDGWIHRAQDAHKLIISMNVNGA